MSGVSQRYYTRDVLARAFFWTGILAGILVLVWSPELPGALALGVTQLVMLLAGLWMYPEARLGVVDDNPLKRKTARQRRYATSPTLFLIAIAVGLAVILLVQWYLIAASFSVEAGASLGFYVRVSAAISESYLLHWGIQTNIASYVHPVAGVLTVPVLAVFLHSAVYGQSGIALVAVFVSFLVLAAVFEYTHRLSIPIIVHLLVNLVV